MLEILSVEAGKGANVAVHTHSLFVRHVRLVPFHAVGEGNVDVRMIRQVNGVFVRAGNVNADDIITVVRNVEIQMGVNEMVALRFPVEKQVVLKVADVTPNGKLVQVHFKIILLFHRFSESVNLGAAQGLLAKHAPVDVVAKVYFVLGLQFLVASKNFAKTVCVLWVIVDAVRQVKVLVYLVRIIVRTYFVRENVYGVVELV